MIMIEHYANVQVRSPVGDPGIFSETDRDREGDERWTNGRG